MQGVEFYEIYEITPATPYTSADSQILTKIKAQNDSFTITFERAK